MDESKKHAVIVRLESLASEKSQDRGLLAKLRRAQQDAVEAYPLILPYLPQDINEWELKQYVNLAALFAMHPNSAEQGNFGAHMRIAAGEAMDATERRFLNLLRADSEDLPVLLRQSVSFLRSKDVNVNWEQLRRDLLAWDHPDSYVQKNWARSFWGYEDKTKSKEEKGE